MAFSDINDERRIYINLSDYALSTIYDDMFSFDVATESSFINKIFKNYRNDAMASVFLQTEKYKINLYNELNHIQSEDKRNIIESLAHNYAQTLMERNLSYPKGKSRKYKLNTDNLYNYLCDTDYCNEDIYYQDKISLYLKAVIEEYCRKTYIEREYIYYKDPINILKTAITTKKLISVQLDNELEYKIKPYSIISNKENTYNYLVGYSPVVKDNTTTDAPYPVRISRIRKIKVLSANAFISKEKADTLLNLINKKGVQFLSSKECSFTVELTDLGLKMYNSIHHMRPTITEKSSDGHTLTFMCPQSQFEFYFFKFGADAKVIFPHETRERFKELYTAALQSYQ